MLKSICLALLASVALPVVMSETNAGAAVPGPDGSLNPCHDLTNPDAIDACYMRLALEHVMIHNPQFPFGALIVDHTTNEISCFGANSNRKNKLLHGETTAFWNCTELYPSPTQNDMTDPGLDWSHQTLYTTGEPCPMCAAQSFYRGVGRVVWGTSIPDINQSGREQLLLEMNTVIGSSHLGGHQRNLALPQVVGGVLKDECDHAFWCAFKRFRDDAYFSSMSARGLDGYIRERDAKFPCVHVPVFRKQYD